MAATGKHIIRRQLMEFSIAEQSKAQALQQRISTLCRDLLREITDRVCNDLLAPGQTLRLQTLDLDLGGIAWSDLDHEVPRRFEQKLREELQKQVAVNTTGKSSEAGEPTPGDSSPLALIRTFLRQGYRPWWAGKDTPDFASLFAQEWKSNRTALLALTAPLLKESTALHRLILQLPDALLQELVQASCAHHAGVLLHCHSEAGQWLTSPSVQRMSSSRRRLITWQATIQTCIRKESTATRIREHYFASLIAGIISGQRIPTAEQYIGLLWQEAARNKRSMPQARESLRALALAIYKQKGLSISFRQALLPPAVMEALSLIDDIEILQHLRAMQPGPPAMAEEEEEELLRSPSSEEGDPRQQQKEETEEDKQTRLSPKGEAPASPHSKKKSTPEEAIARAKASKAARDKHAATQADASTGTGKKPLADAKDPAAEQSSLPESPEEAIGAAKAAREKTADSTDTKETLSATSQKEDSTAGEEAAEREASAREADTKAANTSSSETEKPASSSGEQEITKDKTASPRTSGKDNVTDSSSSAVGKQQSTAPAGTGKDAEQAEARQAFAEKSRDSTEPGAASPGKEDGAATTGAENSTARTEASQTASGGNGDKHKEDGSKPPPDSKLARERINYPLPRMNPAPWTRIKLEGELIQNAGLVLLWPYLTPFFDSLGLLSEAEAPEQGTVAALLGKNKKQFASEEAAWRGVHLSQYLATGLLDTPEEELLLNKLLCGLPLHLPVPKQSELSTYEEEECMILLNDIIANWTALRKASPDTLRASFLCREGLLSEIHKGYSLQITRNTFDILLDRLPWSYSLVALPWMEKMIYVEW